MNLEIIHNPQIITQDNKPAYAVLPYQEYIALLEAVEDYLDVLEMNKMRRQIETRDEELIPDYVVYALLDGQNPVKVWREYRGLTQTELAKHIGISKALMSQIESGTRSGDRHLAKIAAVLNLDVDDLETNS